MRQLLSFVAAAVTVVALLTALGLIAFGYELHAVADRASPQPQALPLADLIKKGPGENAHVTLSEFRFGTPVLEQSRTGLNGAWVPLYAPGSRAKDATPPALLYVRRVRSQAELDELLKQASIDMLVASALPRLAKRISPAVQLYTAYPKLDPQKTAILTEPVLAIGGFTLPAKHWFNPNLPLYAWGAAGVALFIGVSSGFGWHRARRLAERVREEEAAREPTLARQNDPDLISLHRFTLKHSKFMICCLGIAMGCLIVIALLCTEPAVRMAMQGHDEAAIPGILGLVMLAGAAALGLKLLADYRLTIREVAVMQHGLRWLRNKRIHDTAWADIQSIYKEDLIYVTVGSGARSDSVHKLTLRLNDGRVLRFNKETLEDYDRFAELVQSIHSRYVIQRKERDLAEHGVAKFGPIVLRTDGVQVGRAVVPWSDLERSEVVEGHFKLHAPNTFRFLKSRQVALKEIPNYVALVEMLRPKAAVH